jgi:dolichol-phosphate mannosyltransferase
MPKTLIRTDPSPAPQPTSAPKVGRVLVIVPTYDERETIVPLVTGIRIAVPDADVLVVDDGSPDGTAEIAGALGVRLGRIAVMHREAKLGLGAAYRAGFEYGLSHGYDVLVEMDADLSHSPAALPALLDAIAAGADLAIGSRYVPGASIPDWTPSRRALSRFGNRYAAFMLGHPIADLTSGYRAYRADALRAADAATSSAAGYAFQIELAHRVAGAGLRVTEVPITFTDRVHGHSKMSWRIAAEALALVTWWRVRDGRARSGADR